MLPATWHGMPRELKYGSWFSKRLTPFEPHICNVVNFGGVPVGAPGMENSFESQNCDDKLLPAAAGEAAGSVPSVMNSATRLFTAET